MTESSTNTKQDRARYLLETKSLRDMLADLRKAELWLMLAALAAFLASAFFVVKYFVGGEMDPSIWTGEQWANAVLGLGITAVITSAQAFLYASGYKGPAALVATAIVVFFGLFSEVSQSMEREDATVRQRSLDSPVFQAALGSIENLSERAVASQGDPRLAAAQGKLARHEAELAACAGKYNAASQVQRCEKYELGKIAEAKGELAAAEAASSGAAAQVGSALSAAITQAKTLEYDEDKHYAMIRLLQNMFNVGGIWASFLFSIIIIGTFEYAFHFVGAYVADHKRALLLAGRDANGQPIDKLADNMPLAAAGIPKDYGNRNRDDYLNHVSPERQQHTRQHRPKVSKAVDNSVPVQEDSPSTVDNSVPVQSETPQTVDNFAKMSKSVDKSVESVDNFQDQQAERPEPLQAPVRDLSRERFFKLIYMEIRTRVMNQDLKPTVRPVTDAVTEVIRHHTQTLGLQPSLIGKPERQKIAEKILEKLEQEQILELNPKRGVGKPKYVLASRWAKQADAHIAMAGQAIR